MDTKPATPASRISGYAAPAQRPVPTPAAPELAASRTQKMTINVPTDLVDAAKNAFWADRGGYRTFSAWVAEALERQITDTMTRHGLQQLPTRPGEGLPPGRPLK